MNLTDALAKLNVEHRTQYYLDTYPEDGLLTNVEISREISSRVVAELGNEWCDFGTFDNCREYGLTFSVPGWQFCVYEHRNSDDICVQGCPMDLVEPYGPYGDSVDKYDVLEWASWQQYDDAARLLIAGLRYVKDNPTATRREVQAAMRYRVIGIDIGPGSD